MMRRRYIVTRHVHPPIPARSLIGQDRRWDWMAVWDDYDDDPECRHPVGRGPSIEAAIQDLKIETGLRA